MTGDYNHDLKYLTSSYKNGQTMDSMRGLVLVLLVVLWISGAVYVAARGITHALIWNYDGNNAMDKNQDLILPDDLKNIHRIHSLLKTKSEDIYFADSLNKYGCWCAQNGTSNPVDELDRCCLEHQMCLKKILLNGCPVSSRYYVFKQCFDSILKCTDRDQCKHQFCMCDIEAADCLSNRKLYFNQRWKEGNKAYCIKI
ncbi:phospholipase A2, membrane associated-like [Mytilus californianus]|uniref:phospholipase A2, membrane associated-like n=1 Tax=Mytilus californianus TaxID=6549 RepID=UPI002246D2E4|nr:phospholipase A2, membrane associated-like [Mytilus californianus]